MAIDINVPSQVKNYANLAAFPATGSLKTIFIAEDTNKTYRWTGSAYVEISASQATAWGTITGTLSAQTDLNTALSGKVPTTRTLTINGTTQDLSADRTFTVSTGITIGTTAITSGTVGRVLFEGTGNVVQESANLFWDNTNGRLGIGTSSPAQELSVQNGAIIGNASFGGGLVTTFDGTWINLVRQGITTIIASGSGGNAGIGTLGNAPFTFLSNGLERLRIFTTGNIGINTTTDAGFKLDVNGTARVQNTITLTGINTPNSANLPLALGNFMLDVQTTNPNSAAGSIITTGAITKTDSGVKSIINVNNAVTSTAANFNTLNGFAFTSTISQTLGTIRGIYIAPTLTASTDFRAIETTVGKVCFNTTSGNTLIGTTTDAGYKLDVNGTARVSDNVLLTNGIIATSTATTRLQGSLNYFTHNRIASSGVLGFQISSYGTANSFWRYNDGTGDIEFGNVAAYGVQFFGNNTARAKMWSNGQWTIGSGTAYTASALMALEATDRGFLPPRMTTTQKNAIATPATGLMVYDNVLNRPCFYDGTSWITL